MGAIALSKFLRNNNDRINALLERYGSYQPRPVEYAHIERWLKQFKSSHYELALNLLEKTEFYAPSRINRLLKELLQVIKVDLRETGIRKLEDIIFVPVGSTGESGHEIITRFRNVNQLASKRAKLHQLSELPQIVYDAQKNKKELAIVFIDDFIGTGSQFIEYWTNVVSQLLDPNIPIIVGTIVACGDGIAKIETDTPVKVLTVHQVPLKKMLPKSTDFTDVQKKTILNYCKQVGNPPYGYGNLGLMLAFAHGTPNNALAILRGSKAQRHWSGILPRYDDLP